MKLNKLIIHNIASIEHADIDFCGKELNDEPLFLISGDTGSGKTTILDAICLALYKTTPRMEGKANETFSGFSNYKDKDDKRDTISINDTRLLLRRNTANAYSHLEFESQNGERYMAKWEVRKSHNKEDGKLQKTVWELENLTKGVYFKKDWEISNEILNCVGMNFNQFCRTCMLSQGEFTKFLKSSPNEKSEILEKLTQTQVYSLISQNIYQITKNKYTELEHKNIELQSINLLDNEAKSLLVASITEDTEQINKINNEILLINKKKDYLNNILSLEKELKTKEQELDSATQYINSGEYKTQSDIVELWNNTTVVRSQISEKIHYEDELKQQKDKLSLYKDKFLLLKNGLDYETNFLRNILDKHKDIDKEIETKQQEINTIQQQLQTYNQAELLSDYKALLKDKEDIRALKNSVINRNQSKEPLNNIKLKIQDNQKLVQDNRTNSEHNNSLLSEAQIQFQDAKTQYEKIASSLDSWAKKTRLTLNKGDKCPLCGQIIDNVFNDDDFAQIVKLLKDKLTKTQKDVDTITQKQNKTKILLERLQNEYVTLQKEQDKSRKEFDKYSKEVENYLNVLKQKYDLTDDIVNMDLQINNIQKAIDEIDDKRNKISDLSKQIGVLQTQKTELLSVKHNIENAKTLIFSCNQIVEYILPYVKKWETSDTNPKKVNDLLNEWNKFKDYFFGWVSKGSELKNNIKQLENNIDNFFADNPNINIEKIDLLKNYTQKTIESIKRQQTDIVLRQNSLQGVLNSLRERIEQTKKIDFEIKESENLEELNNEFNNLNTLLSQTQQRVGANQNKLEEDKKNQLVYTEKLQEKEILEKEFNKWNILNEALGSADGKKFRKIAQRFILGDLLDKSNYYLQRFSDRWELCSHQESLSILIKDKFEGGLLSSSANLSGGESFMVSLSLALGLSKMSMNNAFCDILFIDEGFGTLSADYLNVVMETLEKLHQIGGRKVGIISHVSDLKERISAQIQVKRKDNTSSVVEVVRI